MAGLTYSMTASLDGYIADEDGKFDWAEPGEEVHTFINDLGRPVGTYLLGRRMYEVLAYWDDPSALDEQPPFVQEFAGICQGSDKVVYSRTLETAWTGRTRIERDFDPEAMAIAASISSWWTNAGSATALCFFSTAPGRDVLLSDAATAIGGT